MIKKTLLSLFLISLFASCSSIMGHDYSSRTRNLELGMTKSQVVNVMSKDYKIVEAFRTPDGDTVEVLKFADTIYSNYILHFVNGELDRWYKKEPTPEEIRIFNERTQQARDSNEKK